MLFQINTRVWLRPLSHEAGRQLMLEFAAVIRVPEADVVQGKAGPGLVDTQSAALNGPPLRVQVTDTPPRDAYVAAQ